MLVCWMLYFGHTHTHTHTVGYIVLQNVVPCSWLVFIDISEICIVLTAERLPAVSGAKRLQLAAGLTLGGGLRQPHRTPRICTKPAFVLHPKALRFCAALVCFVLLCSGLMWAVVRSLLLCWWCVRHVAQHRYNDVSALAWAERKLEGVRQRPVVQVTVA